MTANVSTRKPHSGNAGYVCELKARLGGHIVVYDRRAGFEIDADYRWIVMHEPSSLHVAVRSQIQAREIMQGVAKATSIDEACSFADILPRPGSNACEADDDGAGETVRLEAALAAPSQPAAVSAEDLEDDAGALEDLRRRRDAAAEIRSARDRLLSWSLLCPGAGNVVRIDGVTWSWDLRPREQKNGCLVGRCQRQVAGDVPRDVGAYKIDAAGVVLQLPLELRSILPGGDQAASAEDAGAEAAS